MPISGSSQNPTMSTLSGLPGRRRKPQEFLLPDGRKVIVTLPENYDELRKHYADTDCSHVEVVIHGSEEHHGYLRESHAHHEDRHRRLTERHGRELLEEMQDIQDQLSSLKVEMERLTSDNGALSHSFNKFGYSAALRTYDDENSSSRPSMSDFGSEKTATSWEDPRPGDTVKIFKRPVIKQWLHRGLLWRASEHTEIMAVELFFDLLYVGIIHVNGEHVSEEANGKELLRFVVTFVMSWNIWSDVTRYVSWFETDDVFTQIMILFEIVCLLGLTTNMTYAFDDDHSTYTPLVTFYLAARLKNAVTHAATGFALPMIKQVLFFMAVLIALPSTLWIASIYVPMPYRLALIFPALTFDVYDKSIIFAFFALAKRYETTSFGKRLSKVFEFYPAINIEHRTERTNAFVSLVFGYSVVGVMFQSHSPVVIDAFLGKAFLGLIQAFIFNWIYFDIDASNLHVHAIRRSGFSTGLWSFAHLPFVMGYILATAAMSKLVLATDVPNANASTLGSHYSPLAEPEVSDGIRLFYCYGLGIALFSMNLISLSHEHRQPPNLRWKKNHRLANRFAICLIFFGLPFATRLKSQSLIAVSMSLILEVLLVELWGTSCPNDPFIGERKGVCVRYRTHCCKRDLKKALKEEQKRNPEKFQEKGPGEVAETMVVGDAMALGKENKTVTEEV